MANITLTIPDAVLPRVVDAVAVSFNYTDNKIGAETKGQFAKRMLITTLKQWVKNAENGTIDTASRAQRVTNEADIETNVAIT